MAAAVKISDVEMSVLREAAALQGRSISGQAEHWFRLGRAIERDPRFGFVKVEQALKGLADVDDLSTAGQEEYMDQFSALLSKPSSISDAFFDDRRRLGLGVGMDEAGNIIEQRPSKCR